MNTVLTFDEVLNADFFQVLGLESLPAEEKKQIVQTMTETILGRVYVRYMDELGEERAKNLDDLSSDQLLDYLHAEGINVEMLSFEEATKYRVEVLTALKGGGE